MNRDEIQMGVTAANLDADTDYQSKPQPIVFILYITLDD